MADGDIVGRGGSRLPMAGGRRPEAGFRCVLHSSVGDGKALIGNEIDLMGIALMHEMSGRRRRWEGA